MIEDLKVNFASFNYFKYDYSHFCEEVFVQEIAELDFCHIYNYYCNLTTNDKFNIFYDQINPVFKKHMPYKKLSKKKAKLSFKPWITKEILSKIKFRDRLYQKLFKSKELNPNLQFLSKNFRNAVVKDIQESKSKYFNLYFSSYKHNNEKNYGLVL